MLETIPHDNEAERHVIGACLLSENATSHAITSLTEKDFLYIPHGWMFTAIGKLFASQEPVTAQTVARKLAEMRPRPNAQKTCLEEIGGPDEVFATLEGVAPEDVEFWATRVVKKRKERDLLALAEKMRRAALSNPEDVDKLLSRFEENLADVSTRGAGRTVYTMDDDSDGLDERIQRYIDDPDAITGVPIGWGVLDRMLDGLQPGNVTIVYAPSSRYKSLFTANMGWMMARNGIPGMWFTSEMPRVQVRERILQLELGLNLRWLRRDRDVARHVSAIRRTKDYIKTLPIIMNDTSDLDIGYIRAEVMKQRKWNDIQYVLIDLVDMVSASQYREDSIAQQSLVMRQMKEMAKQANIHVILVSHVAKGDKSIRQKPDLDVEDMKGSSSKYQDVDTAISLMPVVWSGEKEDWIALDRKGIAYHAEHHKCLTVLVSITKNRHGELGSIPFELDFERGMRMYPKQFHKQTRFSTEKVESES